MTTETQTIVDLCDIKRVLFECTACKAQIKVPFPDTRAPSTEQCPACRKLWNGATHEYFPLLVELEKQMEENAKGGAQFHLRLEIADG